MSGRNAGIYAIADIRTNPNYSDEEPAIAEKYWIIGSDEANETKEKHKEELRVMLNYKIRLLNNPILKEEIKGIPELKNMLILRNAIGTNFPVQTHEWEIISKLVQERFN